MHPKAALGGSVVRRLIIAGLAAGLAAPLSVTPTASASQLFTCPEVTSDSYMYFRPGLSHTQTTQDHWGVRVGTLPIDPRRCSARRCIVLVAGSRVALGRFGG